MPFFVMAKTVLKSLFRRPVTRKYPFAPRQYYKNTRGKINIEIRQCIFCGICQKKCPTAAIKVDKEQKSWEIDRMRCIACGYCVEVCPKKCLSMHNQYTPAKSSKQKDKYQNA